MGVAIFYVVFITALTVKLVLRSLISPGPKPNTPSLVVAGAESSIPVSRAASPDHTTLFLSSLS